MNKKLLLIILASLVVLVVFIVLNIKKVKSDLRKKTAAAISVSDLFIQAKDLEAKSNLLAAKSTFQRLINEFPGSGEVMNWQKRLEDINIKLLFSKEITAGCILYEIKPGDTLTKIAREFKTTPELIMKSNNLTSDRISPGRRLKVWASPFSIVVDKSQNILILKTNEELVKTYIVSTGKDNSTPIGNFKIANKLTNPTWFKAGAVVSPSSPENILGTRWLGFDLPGYGIHGSTDPQSLGKQVTQGCVRMSNPEVEELYLILPQGTEVTVVD